ncbi:MAG: hypothetical protein IJ290_08285, partial [Bacteroidaceae bacterium]|nr:hypothetical protein [Bacteroidaceae bacterium]
AQREQSQACLNYAEPARNLNAEHYNSQLTIPQRSESRVKLLGLAKCWAGLELCRRRERVSVLGQAKRKHCDEGGFSLPEELQLVALLQGILMRSIIIHDFSMKWAFSEDSRHPTEKKVLFLAWQGAAELRLRVDG